MVTLSDIQAQLDTAIESVRQNTDATSSVAAVVQALKDQVASLQEELDTAIANQADPAELQAISDKIAGLIQSVDADSVAEAALSGTESE